MSPTESAPEGTAPAGSPARTSRFLTFGGIAGLVLGVLAGNGFATFDPATRAPWVIGADALILAWTNAFRLIVPLLVVSQLYLAVTERRARPGEALRLGIMVPVVFAALLVFTAIATILTTAGALQLHAFQGLSLVPASPAAGGTGSPAGAGDRFSWVNDLIPPNLVGAAATDNILPLMLFTLAFALAARRLAPALQHALGTAFAAVRGASFVLVDWLLRPAPIVLFALAFRSAVDSGYAIGGVLVAFTAICIAAHLLVTLAMYPIASLLGGIAPGTLARALVPSQIVAVSTRSSLATIPALLSAAEGLLRLPTAVTSLVIPLGGAVLKLSRAVSSPAKFLFLAHVLGIHMGLEQIAVFTITIILLSPSTTGTPRVISNTRSLPAFVSAGIPPQFVLLLSATTAVTDIFMTVLNTTGYLVAAVLVGRFSGQPAPMAERKAGEPVPANAPASDLASR